MSGLPLLIGLRHLMYLTCLTVLDHGKLASILTDRDFPKVVRGALTLK